MQQHWDIFCRVIDNFGDIGVCWRLARQLASEHAVAVRIWVDEPNSLQALCPSIDPELPRQSLGNIEICRWTEHPAFEWVADVVIEAFACELPAAYIAAMAGRTPKPCWINLEYLTAESWAEGCHGMASPHPTLPLVKYFFFPGFSPQTGGLLRETELLAARNLAHHAKPAPATLEISLFCYDTAPVGPLLDGLALSPRTINCYVPPGKPLSAVKAHLGGDGPWQIGNLKVQPIAFMSQDEYDRLLWRCDLNFVRGEDSFLRAQWAGQAFVWQIYEQEEAAHLLKLEAFLERYTEGLEDNTKTAVRAMFEAWNTGHGLAEAWPTFLAALPSVTLHTRHWADQLAQQPDLASSLVNYCSPKV